MGHLTRQEVPAKWPIKRKGTTYVVRAGFDFKEGVPVLIVLREMLGVAQTRKEAKRIIHLRQVLLNEKEVHDEKNNVLLFDTIKIPLTKKYYRMELTDKGKFFLNEVKESETERKIAKVTNKKMLKGKKVQLNFSDGRNVLTDAKCNVNDSAVINFKSKKIEKFIPLKEKAKVVIFSGKHVGKKGEILEMKAEDKTAKVKAGEKEINVLINQIMAVE